MRGVVIGTLAASVAVLLTPASGSTAESGLQGLPRLLAYLIGGTVLALTVPRCGRGAVAPNGRPLARPGAAALAVGAVVAVALTAIELVRLRGSMADPFAPALWIGSMLVLLGVTLWNGVRGLGWRPAWPAPGFDRRLFGVAVGIVVLAGALRVPGLEDLPAGINADEGDRAASAFDVLSGTGPRSWFDSGWFYINMVYFRLLAVSFASFGTGVGGGRMLNAVAGTAFVAVVAWSGCRHFGWRVGLLAAAFAAGAGLSLQHSRMISETGPTALLWALSLAGFLEGARSGRPWAFVLAGLGGGLSLYFYPSARLWAVGAIISVLALLVVYGRRPERRVPLLAGVALAALASLIAAAPFLAHLNQQPLEISNRFAQTSVLDPANQVRLPYLSAPEALPRLAALQIERTLGMFDRYPDGGGLLPTGRPIFPRPIAALVLLSIVYGSVRAVRDLRFALLAIWFWIGLSGVVLTVETPNVLRAVGILPSLFVLVAALLVDVADRVLTYAHALRPSGARRAFGVALPALVAILIVGSEVTTYFGTFRTMQAAWGPSTREGQQVAALGASGPVYSLEMNEHLVSSGWVRLLAPEARRGRLPNPGRDLLRLMPAPDPGQALSMLFARDPQQHSYFELVRALYPAGRLVDAADGRQAYVVPATAVDATRGTIVRRAGAPPRPAATFGDVTDDVALPASVTWSGGVWLAGGPHRLEASGAGRPRVRIDGLELEQGAQVDAARGIHYVELTADMAGAHDAVALAVDGRMLDSGEIYRLMDAPWGLLGRIGSAPTTEFVDATVAMAFFDPALGRVVPPTSITWSGELLAPRTGIYRMVLATEDTMRLEVDGQNANIANVQPGGWERVGLGSAVHLTAGPHRVRVTLDVTHGGRNLARWDWIPPQADGSIDGNGQWTVVPPTVLRPDSPVRRL